MRSSASTGGHPGLRSYIRQPDQPPLTWADAEAINASPKLALGSAEQFDLVTRRLAANQRDARRNTTHPYLLRGLVSCGVCRLSCSGVTRTATDTRYRYYRCRGKMAQISSVRASVARQRQRLLEAYLAEVIDLACFQRQDRGLAGQETDLLAREREVTAQGERLVQVSAIAQSTTQVLKGLRVGLGQASFEQRRQLVELL